MTVDAVLLFAMVLLTGLVCQLLAWRLKMPVILFLLLSGVIEGPLLHILNPDKQLGDMLRPFITLSAAIILFEGSLTLQFKNIPGLERVIQNLITIGAVITWILITLSTHWIIHFPWSLSFLFAALMVVTGPTVIVPLLKTLRPNANITNVLKWEGILIDPIGAILAVLVFVFILSEDIDAGFLSVIFVFFKVVLIGVAFGVMGATFFGVALKKYWIPQQLQNFAILTLVCVTYALSNYLERDSGLLTVTVMGVCLANFKNIELSDIINFKENLSTLLISFLFIILAARIDLTAFITLGWPAIILLAVIQFLIRPANVYISALGSKLTLQERHLIAWIGPRGVIAAAISAIFAIRLEGSSIAGVEHLVPLTFFIIVGTVLIQSLTAKTIAKRLKVAEPEPKGFLIIGANKLARSIAKQLVQSNIPICLADENWAAIRAAKMEGLTAYWGNPISTHAEDNLNLLPIKHLLVLTPQLDLNILAAQHFRHEFAADCIYAIQTTQSQEESITDKTRFKYCGRILFKQDTNYEQLNTLIHSGYQIKTTLLTEQFSYADYLALDAEKKILLFAMDSNGTIYVYTEDMNFKPDVGWKIVGLTL